MDPCYQPLITHSVSETTAVTGAAALGEPIIGALLFGDCLAQKLG